MTTYQAGKTISSFISKSLTFSTLMILLIQVFMFQTLPVKSSDPETDFYFGVDVAYADLPAIKNLIDKVSPYTNIFVVGSTGITYNPARLDETCQYLYDKGLSFIIYSELPFRPQWFEGAKNRWNTQFLGYYVFDEPGGRQLDRSHRVVREAQNYTDAANRFVNYYNTTLNSMGYTDSTNFTVFTSDYALYWFDYKAGYDVMFAEFGWNYSRQINIALNRGAATIQDKDWGVIITWTYNNPPYIESGTELYNDLVLAYENGAKYVLIFDSNEAYTAGILKEEHYDALEQFWQYTQDNPRNNNQQEKRVAFVLPKGYGYGFRGPEDKIWGLWESDDLSLELSHHVGNLLEVYGTKLDIIYDEDYGFNFEEQYSEIYFTNGTYYKLPKPEPDPPTEDIISVFVKEVIDGDTFKTGEGYTIRLADIDAPEIDEIGYLESTEYLESLIENRTVILDIDSKTKTDPYGRYICLVYVQYTSSHFINVNQALVAGGYAIVDDYTNNEFNPEFWTLYSTLEMIPEFQLFLVFPLFLFTTVSAIIIKIKIEK
ncbi:thermonuclease family protein, partial [Candidatus Bathyarchaeota archaeon]|nr:thermonuclease family protein [Candidatus Bathyarchaeota archaeon]